MVWILGKILTIQSQFQSPISIQIAIWWCFWPSTFKLVVFVGSFAGTGHYFLCQRKFVPFAKTQEKTAFVIELIGSEFCFCFHVVSNQWNISDEKACAGHIKLLLNMKSNKRTSLSVSELKIKTTIIRRKYRI